MNMTRLLGIGAWTISALLCSACANTVDTGSGGSGGGTTGTNSTGTNSTGPGPTCPPGGAPCCGPGPQDPCCIVCTGTGMGGFGGAGGTTTTGGGGTTCGGFAGAPCAAGEFCDFGNDLCGGNDNSGVCTKRPLGCPDFYQPTCGCDGKVYGNPCDANSQGTDANDGASCTPPAGMFGCGAQFCAQGTEYCQMNGSDVANVPSTYQCQPLPASCGNAASCACLAGVQCGGKCMPTSNGGLQVTCLGG